MTNPIPQKQNKPKLKLTSIPRKREEWLAKRSEGIGGSEVGAVMGVNPYQCSLEVFYKKVGLLPEEFTEDNFKMMMGRVLEPQIAELWKHWDGSPESVVENFENKTPIRNCIEVSQRIQNLDYPWLLGHVDRIICKDANDLHNPENGILEIKNINHYAVKQWEDGVPPYQLYQLQSYLAITGLKYGEIVMLKDGNNMEVVELPRNESLIADIIYKTGEFWQYVEVARLILASEVKTDEEKEIAIEEIANNIKTDQSKSWEDFMKKYYQPVPNKTIKGDDILLKIAKDYNEVSNEIKNLEDFKQGFRNELIRKFGSNEIAEFEGNGKITYKADSRGTRKLLISLKHFEFA